NLHFDVETAIKVCRQAGYHEHALDLAKTHDRHHWYIEMLLQDLHRDKEVLHYVKQLNFHDVRLMRQSSSFLTFLFPSLFSSSLPLLLTPTLSSSFLFLILSFVLFAY